MLAYMLYRARHPRHRGHDVVVPSKPFCDAGFSKHAKGRALRRLERAKIIRITAQYSHRSPRAMLTWPGL